MAAKIQSTGKQTRKSTVPKRRAKTPAPAGPDSKRAGRTASPPTPGSSSPPSPSPAGAGIKWTPAAGEVGIRVRMYRVGFGDFFLITCLNGDEKPLP